MPQPDSAPAPSASVAQRGSETAVSAKLPLLLFCGAAHAQKAALADLLVKVRYCAALLLECMYVHLWVLAEFPVMPECAWKQTQ